MHLTPNTIQDIQNGKFELDFPKLTLTQQSSGEKTVFAGPGTISQTEDGRLQVKMFHTYETSDELFRDFNGEISGQQVEVGKIISDETYFALSGVDMQGRTWTARRIWLSGDLSFPTQSRVVKSVIHHITCESTTSSDSGPNGKIFIAIPGELDLHWNSVEATVSGKPLQQFSSTNGDSSCKITKHSTFFNIAIQAPVDTEAEEYSGRILDAIAIATGKYLAPIAQTVKVGSLQRVTVFSQKVSANADDFLQSIPCRKHTNPANLEAFLWAYVQRIGDANSQIAGYWYRVHGEQGGNIENQALVLSTAIEGLLKAYFSQLSKPDDEFLGQLDSATNEINNLKVGGRVKERIVSTLTNARTGTPKNALFALSKDSRLPKELIPLWTKLRNRSAHADQLKMEDKELQGYLDDIYACTELFFRLIFLYIKYSGEIIQYSKSGWPVTEVKNGA